MITVSVRSCIFRLFWARKCVFSLALKHWCLQFPRDRWPGHGHCTLSRYYSSYWWRWSAYSTGAVAANLEPADVARNCSSASTTPATRRPTARGPTCPTKPGDDLENCWLGCSGNAVRTHAKTDLDWPARRRFRPFTGWLQTAEEVEAGGRWQSFSTRWRRRPKVVMAESRLAEVVSVVAVSRGRRSSSKTSSTFWRTPNYRRKNRVSFHTVIAFQFIYNV